MNVLFLTLVGFESLKEKGIYTDLLREFIKNGHYVYVVSPIEKKQHKETYLINEENAQILRLKIGNTQKTNIVEKGLSTVMIEPTFKKAIKRFFSNVKFDFVMYSTPPITLVGAIKYVKKRDNARTYLLLKDIFPQNAVDMEMITKSGIKGLLYWYFRNKEKKLYEISDRIGCMSLANVDYVIEHNPDVNPKKIEVCPNSIEVVDMSVDENTRKKIRAKYDIPFNKKVFIYGGNLGKPQGIPFLIECLKKCANIDDAFFLIAGDGTEYGLLEEYVKASRQKNVKLMKRLSKNDYDTLVGACDVGMIFLDHRFTIPNYPSRLLTYLQAKLPVLASTDLSSDIKNAILDGNFGWWCCSIEPNDFYETVKSVINQEDLTSLGENGYSYLTNNYDISYAYKTIIKSI